MHSASFPLHMDCFPACNQSLLKHDRWFGLKMDYKQKPEHFQCQSLANMQIFIFIENTLPEAAWYTYHQVVTGPIKGWWAWGRLHMEVDWITACWWLTLSCNEALKINGDRHPHWLSVVLRPEAPHAHIHGLGPRLGCQACEEEGLLGEVVGLPAAAFVCGEPGWWETRKSMVTVLPPIAK